MKKLVTVAMTGVLALALGACSVSSEQSVETNVSVETSSEEEEAAPSAEGADALYIGSIEDDTYVNEYLGIQLVIPEGFGFIDDETLASEVNGGVAPTDDGDGAYVACAPGDEAYVDAFAQNDDGDYLLVEASYLGEDFETDPNSEEYVDSVREYAIDRLGDATVEWSQGTYELEDYTFPMVRLSTTIDGEPVWQQYLCLVLNGYSVNVVASASTEEALDGMLGGVTLLNQ